MTERDEGSKIGAYEETGSGSRHLLILSYSRTKGKTRKGGDEEPLLAEKDIPIGVRRSG